MARRRKKTSSQLDLFALSSDPKPEPLPDPEPPPPPPRKLTESQQEAAETTAKNKWKLVKILEAHKARFRGNGDCVKKEAAPDDSISSLSEDLLAVLGKK